MIPATVREIIWPVKTACTKLKSCQSPTDVASIRHAGRRGGVVVEETAKKNMTLRGSGWLCSVSFKAIKCMEV